MIPAKAALCHEWITTYGGSEVVAATIAEALKIDDVYAFAVEPRLAGDLFPESTVRAASRLGDTAFARRSWAWLLPAMGRAWAGLDLSPYDVVITSAHACVNSIEPPKDVPVVSYCHTPMRYAWEWRDELGRIPRPLRPAWPLTARWLRRTDRRRSNNVTRFVANSSYVAARIERYYNRESTVVYPPTDTDFWSPANLPREDFFLAAGRLVSYKRADLVVKAATTAGARLVVAGKGPELARLRHLAGPSISFEENPSNERLRSLYRRTKGLVFAGVEDFGMTLVEAQACGAPVIAYARGGALESVIPDDTGILFDDPRPAPLAELLAGFDPDPTLSRAAVSNASRFDRKNFIQRFTQIVSETLRSQ